MCAVENRKSASVAFDSIQKRQRWRRKCERRRKLRAKSCSNKRKKRKPNRAKRLPDKQFLAYFLCLVSLCVLCSASKGFFKKPDFEAAAELFDKAATAFRNAKATCTARLDRVSPTFSNFFFSITICVVACARCSEMRCGV